ncbi:MAG: carbohydrate kinase family protein, partial [Anaerolineae bacterium]|nr:carbohydrate kinase family protein [Anaerolineae bacterium]
MSIVVTGSVAFDYLMTFPGKFREQILPEHLNKLSVSFLVDSKQSFRGGTGPNIAYNLALLGNRPVLFATAGRDFHEFRTWLEEQGVDTSAMGVFEDEFTATFSVITDLEQNQIASFHTGAMARARELSIRQLNGRSIDMVIISPNDPAAMHAYPQECC